MTEFIINLFNDKYVFPAFQVGFLILVIYAIFREICAKKNRFRKKLSLEVTRSEETWNQLSLAYGIASVVLLQIVGSAESLKNHKTIIILLNLAGLLYLTYFNSWFRNKIMGFIIRSKKKKEKL